MIEAWLRQRAVSLGGELREADGHRADPLLVGKAHPAQAQPRRDRQLNHALHIIAITRAQHERATKEYLARKEAEGKTTKGALPSLKRYLARHFHQLLAEPPADHSTATHGQPIIQPHLAAEPEPPAIPPPPPPRRMGDPNTKGQAPSPMVCIG